MENKDREEVIRSDFRSAKKRVVGIRRDSFYKRYYAEGLAEIWSAFDAFLALKFPANTGTEMRRLLCNKYQPIFEKWHLSDEYKTCILRLQKLAPVKDMKPVNPGKDARLDNPFNLFDILFLSYRIRSNLYHGAKLLEGEGAVAIRNRELVEHSLRVTYEILNKILINEGLNCD